MSNIKETILPWLITAMITANFTLMYEMYTKVDNIRVTMAKNTKYISTIVLLQKNVEINTARIRELKLNLHKQYTEKRK